MRMLCGLQGRYIKHVRDIRSVIGLQDGVKDVSALSMLIMPRGAFFLADTYVNIDPTPDELVAIALQARDHLKRFNIEAKAALLSYSNFGSRDGDSAFKMREAYRKLEGRRARHDRRGRDAGRPGAQRGPARALRPRTRC